MEILLGEIVVTRVHLRRILHQIIQHTPEEVVILTTTITILRRIQDPLTQLRQDQVVTQAVIQAQVEVVVAVLDHFPEVAVLGHLVHQEAEADDNS